MIKRVTFILLIIISYPVFAEDNIYDCYLEGEKSFGGDSYLINESKKEFIYSYTNQFGNKIYYNLNLYVDKFEDNILRAYYPLIKYLKKISPNDYGAIEPFILRDWDYLEDYMGRRLKQNEKDIFENLFLDIENIKLYIQINKNDLNYIIQTSPIDTDKYKKIEKLSQIDFSRLSLKVTGNCELKSK